MNWQMTQKKEVKHSVVYESDNDKAPIKSVYVMKAWFWEQGIVGGAFPKSIKVEVAVVP